MDIISLVFNAFGEFSRLTITLFTSGVHFMDESDSRKKTSNSFSRVGFIQKNFPRLG
jgi:hypothetical protein